MTEALRLIGLALLGAAMSALLRAFCRREAALLCEIACGLVLLLRALRLCGSAFSALPEIFARTGLSQAANGALLRGAAQISAICQIFSGSRQVCMVRNISSPISRNSLVSGYCSVRMRRVSTV